MDSLTQIVLGAACGELALGKKIGNKAILFGAIGGTIPDLDVLLGSLFYTNEIDQLAFHRGFMHSLLFGILGSLVFGFIVFELYNTKKRKGTTQLKDWIWLFFLSIFTHPLLDSCTPYGTQLFLPFSDYRVAFNNISVVDPLYTIPFLVCMILTMRYRRSDPKRWYWTKVGLIISSTYMLFTMVNKLYMDRVFEKSFTNAAIQYSRFNAQPTFGNTLLWYAVAEGDTEYYLAFYSLLDKSSTADTLLTVPKNHGLLPMNHPDLARLTWFSKGYFNLTKTDSTYIYKDLRYPIVEVDNPDSSLFRFEVFPEEQRWNTRPNFDASIGKGALQRFIDRIKGR